MHIKNQHDILAVQKQYFRAFFGLLGVVFLLFSGTQTLAATENCAVAALKHGKDCADPLARKLQRWIQLTENSKTARYKEIRDFIVQNPEWPYSNALEIRAEKTMPARTPSTEVTSWFQDHPPKTFDAMLRYLDALTAEDRREDTLTTLQGFWHNGTMSRMQLAKLRGKYGHLLTDADHNKRLDTLLWAKRYGEAESMMGLVSQDQRLLATARLALAKSRPGVDTAVANVPPHLQTHPSLLYERIRWRRKNNRDSGAADLLYSLPENIDQPPALWRERHILARRAIEKKQFDTAYRLTSTHGQKYGFSFAQAEWLSGWLALRFLNKPKLAFDHFHTLYSKVKSPISLGRAAYWAGRASAELNHDDIATQWFQTAARYPTTFYGQAAIATLNNELDALKQPRLPVPSAEENAAFHAQELVHAARLLHAAGKDEYLSPFLHALGRKAESHTDHIMVANLSKEVGHFNTAVILSKRSINDGVMLIAQGYPFLPEAADIRDVDKALVHALIRQESAFDSFAVSSAGARGLMQILPSTAREVARKNNIRYSRTRLTQDKRYNILLGSRYMKGLLKRYNGSFPLAIAAYNAGPGRVTTWLSLFGDPRTGEVDMLDWIESLSIYETRNYVQRVLEGYHVYKYYYDTPGKKIVLYNR